jgi:rhodanese-related sulfurtransferase
MSDTISAATLKHWLQDGNEIALFDVREAGQFGEGHLFFAVPLPYSRLEIDVIRLAPRKSVRVVLTDDGEGVAEQAAQRLETLGYTRVQVLAQGNPGWVAAGYQLFKGVNVPSKTFGELVEHAYHTPHISATELDRWRQSGRPYVLLDGRTVDEHHKMTIPGSVACPNGELPYRINDVLEQAAVDANTPVVINCAGRTRSILGAQTLRNLQLPNPVLALENGTQGWTLAGLALEHGSLARYPEQAADEVHARESLVQVRANTETLRQRFAIPVLTASQAQAWLDDQGRSTFVFDIRSEQEYREKTLPGAIHAPGGQLVQATDQYLGVRNSRLILLDHEQVRAPVVASWLYQLGFEVAILEQGIATAIRVSALPDPVASLPVASGPLVASLFEQGKLALLDIRSSAAYRREHIAGVPWSIRPRLQQWLAAQSNRPSAVVLIADSAKIATLAAQDLRQAGVQRVEWLYGISALVHAGLRTQKESSLPDDAERIDYLFFVHDRHEGNLDAARNYLAWETTLVGLCTADELAVFRLPVTE